MLNKINISDADISYFLGLLITDGNVYINRNNPNKGRVSFELKASDEDVLHKMRELFPYHISITKRIRDTNFSNNSQSVVWCCSRREIRDWLHEIGVPFGKKSHKICFIQGVSPHHFWRGVIDGDGSLGFMKQGLPFVSLVTSSEQLRDDFIKYVHSVTGKTINSQRNKRDGVYNIMITKEDAVLLVNSLCYDDKNNSIPRKLELAQQIKQWSRPDGMRRILKVSAWNDAQDTIVLNHSCEEAMTILNRSKASVMCRKQRIKDFPHC